MPLHGQFTRDGRPTGREIEIPRNIPDGRANDIHLKFDRGAQPGDVTLVFTQNGKEVANHTAPKNAHDVGIEFRDDIDDVSPGNIQARDVYWTDENGRRIGDYIGPPAGANDVHIKLPRGGKFTKGRWSTDGRPWRDEWDPPVDANDFHLGPDSSRTITFHFPKELLFSAAILRPLLAGHVPGRADFTSREEPAGEKPKTTIRAMLGAAFVTGREEGLRITAVLPDSPAAAADLRPGDLLTHLGDESVSDLAAVRGALTGLRAATTLPITVRRANRSIKTKPTARHYVFPYQSFSSGVEYNKFCDKNCDCTLDASGFLCVTVYVYAGEGPCGGVLLRKICGAQESGLPRIDSDCGALEYF